ncbi:MAG TPA: NAD(P)/FAD-dependent oxidoreductase [Roseiflexaceae bacterium]|nr:NAD(P)/FAD-dependent oxidoreductase [Roseiflexaceae bacterium]
MSDAQQGGEAGAGPATAFDAVVIGAGFSGMYMLHRLRGQGLSVRVYEAGDGVGGTWYWNRYPGARCDVPSFQYSYSFSPELDQEWEWSGLYPTQPEVLRYLNHVADRFDLRRDIQLGTRVTAAHYDAAANRWRISTDRGEQVAARFCITAVGCLSAPNLPAIPGLDSFAGAIYHTGLWPHEGVDFSGLRVGVVGTGSTAIQAIPEIARQAAQLYVFQRTPNYSLPARNRALSAEEQAAIKARYPALRQTNRESPFGMTFDLPRPPAPIVDLSPEEREQLFEELWDMGGLGIMFGLPDVLFNLEANGYVADFARRKIAEIVADPHTAALLTPTGYPIGAKRIPIDTDYFETYNRPNVTLVDVRSAPIEAVTPGGLRTRDAEYQLDAIVFATGFDAMTGTLSRIDIRGRDGQLLRNTWADGPRTYLGLQIAGFPNLFTITGPGSPSVLSNMLVSIEQHTDWIAECIRFLDQHGHGWIEPTAEAQEAWTAHVSAVAGLTLFPLADSWYVGANIPGKPRMFLPYAGGVGAYRQRCAEVAATGYEGFIVSD